MKKVKGKVSDAKTGEPMVGAFVYLWSYIDGARSISIAATNIDGIFVFLNVDPEIVTHIESGYMGYVSMKREITVADYADVQIPLVALSDYGQ